MRNFLVEQMAMYTAYHRDARNKATHFVGVPAIAFSLLVPMALVQFGVAGPYTVSLATLFALIVMAYWIWLDLALGLVTSALFVPALVVADWLSWQGVAAVWITFGVAFVGGWIIQLIGHVFEGRKPALLDNLLQIFIAPMFLVTEVVFALGLKRSLAEAVEARAPAYAPKSAVTQAAE